MVSWSHIGERGREAIDGEGEVWQLSGARKSKQAGRLRFVCEVRRQSHTCQD